MGENQSPSKNESSYDRQNVSFKFTKKSTKAFSGNKLDDCDKSTEKDFVISVTKNEIQSSIHKEKQKELVIPLIRKNNWRVENSECKEEDPENKIREMAVKELLQESAQKNEQWENRESQNDLAAIPLIMQNKIPEGYETEDRMDVSLRPDASTVEDYDRVPVEKFGLAILRGMGWKEGDPIGANSKSCIEPIQVQLRPKGLGLGADASALNKVNSKKTKEEELPLIKGAYVHIIQGSEKGNYGQVLGLDEENARAIIKLTTDKTVTFPEFYLDVISKSLYDKERKIINRDSYRDFKIEEEKKQSQSQKNEIQRLEFKDEDNKRNEKRRTHDQSQKSKDSSSGRHPKKTRHSRERSVEKSYTDSRKRSWIRPQLRVRLIDDKYKKGRYFNTKVVVMDVLSPHNCTCKTEDNKYLDDISPSMLETVIPRTEPSYVMIVDGKYSGELCTILKKDKSKCIATVQFLSDREKAIKIEYDSICEYVGDVSEFD